MSTLAVPFPALALAAALVSARLILGSTEAFSLERSALVVSGSGCRQSHDVIIQALERLEGIAQVNDEIPEHLLIDHDGKRRTEEELASFVNGTTHGRCHAAVMRSCITASIQDPTIAPPPKP
jgi:hypothetical protein